MNTSERKRNHLIFFGNEVKKKLLLKVKELRSEEEFYAEAFESKVLLNYIKCISDSFCGNLYLLEASYFANPRNRIRSYKGLLWQREELLKLDHRNWELEVYSGYTRLMTLVDLNEYNFDVPDEIFLDPSTNLLI
ncbi:hypothetical protein [Polycladidibacter stylochi]|uniref:hypothetical protein n=1 Tax=Polycladidibacter stylochi TaxID=1807766 RepID=UPI00082F6470|nr:hypothetical protein [Pseudovibrio stylochi]